jgi:hypothetical protein
LGAAVFLVGFIGYKMDSKNWLYQWYEGDN